MGQGKLYTFQDFVLDVDNACVRQGQEQCPLRPKAFDMLRYFVERPGQLVTRDELFRALWPQTVVDSATLTGCIRAIRTALNDDAKQPGFIETIPTRGYRFIGKVVSSQHSVVSSPSPPNQPSVLSPQSSALVGRDAELVALHQWLDKAQHGERQVVFVTGEPGIGKTTLVEAFLFGVRSQKEFGVRSHGEFGVQNAKLRTENSELPSTSVFIGHGQCVKQYGSGEAYLPVFEALARLGREAHGEQLIAVLQQYAPAWAVQMPGFLSPQDFEALQPRVAGTTRERMLREFAEAVEVFTRERVLVLWFDDLHDSDPSTLGLIAYLTRRQQSARLLLIGTYRPAEILSGEHVLKHIQQELRERRQWQELPLECLNEPTVEDYLKAQFPGSTTFSFPMLARAVYRRTEGNPLFLVSMLADLKAQQVLVQSEGRWHLQANLHEVVSRVPTTLQGTLEGQIHDLQPEEQEVLEAASVAGMYFAVPIVSAATGESFLEAEEICESLARRERFICRDGMEEWLDRTLATRYRFRHALHQDVAYQRIPPLKRSDWHQKIGERKEIAYGERAEEIAAELAVHFEQGRNFQQAVHYFSKAGENAMRRSAYQEAVLQLSKGLELLAIWADTPRRINQELQILTTLGPALMALKGYGASDVENLYNRARGLCQQLGETPQLLPVLGGLWVFYQVRAQLCTARKLAEQILPLTRRLERPTALLHPHMWLGQTLFCLGELRLSREHLEQSISLYDPQRDSPRAAISPQDPGETCLAYTSWALWLLGYPDQALEKSHRARALGEEINHPLSLAHALNFAAWLYQARKESQAVRHCIETVITLLGEEGSSYRLAQATILRGWAQVEQGQVTEGIVLIQQGLSTWKATGAEALLPCYLALLAEAYHKAGNTGAGLDALTSAMEHVNKTEERWYEAELYRLKGTLTLQLANQKSKDKSQKSKIETDPRPLNPDPQSEAETYFLKAIDIAQKQHAKSLELRATTSLARLWHEQGKSAEAHRMLSLVYHWFTEGFDTVDLKDAKALLAQLMPGEELRD